MCFVLRTDKIRYSNLLEELRKGVYRGRDEYPTTVTNAYELLLRTSHKSGTTKDERDNRVTAHEPAEKSKVSCLHNREDSADVEDAVDVEQNVETKILKKK